MSCQHEHLSTVLNVHVITHILKKFGEKCLMIIAKRDQRVSSNSTSSPRESVKEDEVGYFVRQRVDIVKSFNNLVHMSPLDQ